MKPLPVGVSMRRAASASAGRLGIEAGRHRCNRDVGRQALL